MWLMSFNHLLNEYLNCLFVIGDMLVCKLNVIKIVVFVTILIILSRIWIMETKSIN